MHAEDAAQKQSQRPLGTISTNLSGDLFRKVPGYRDIKIAAICLTTQSMYWNMFGKLQCFLTVIPSGTKLHK